MIGRNPGAAVVCCAISLAFAIASAGAAEGGDAGSGGSAGSLEADSDRGAWEIALRFSELDPNDADVRGGAAEQVTLGLNWYLDAGLRFMFNYVRVDNDDDDADVAGDDDPEILQLRAQIDF